MNRLTPAFVAACLSVLLAAQSGRAQSRWEAEGAFGGAWFADESAIPHTIGGGALKWRPTPRVGIGPELTWMVGPGSDRDLTFTGNVTFDFRAAGVTPFVLAGAGFFHHRDRFFIGQFSSTEGGFSGGGGVRVPLGSGWYLAPEARLGWEPHTRLQVSIGRRY